MTTEEFQCAVCSICFPFFLSPVRRLRTKMMMTQDQSRQQMSPVRMETIGGKMATPTMTKVVSMVTGGLPMALAPWALTPSLRVVVTRGSFWKT